MQCKVSKGVCKSPRLVDNSGCICDLRKIAATFSDWNIAKLTGVATYAQLLDSAPGLFEAFPDYRSDGNSSASITSFNTPVTKYYLCLGGWIAPEKQVPIPPNLISTLLADGTINPGDMKRALIDASLGRVYDKYIDPIIHTSRSYKYPQLTLGEIAMTFFVYTVVLAIVIGLIIILVIESKQN